MILHIYEYLSYTIAWENKIDEGFFSVCVFVA